MSRALAFVLLLVATHSLPTSFDARQQWPNCGYSILDQHSCGGCWAFCSAESFADRLCVTGEAPSTTIISPEPILECSDDDCSGGSPSVAWNYMMSSGDTTCTSHCTAGCAPFDSSSGKSPKCHHGTCDSGAKWPATYNPSYFHYMNTTSSSYSMTDVMNHLMQYGPMGASFATYQNFHTFFNAQPNGIYNQTSGSETGRHCVKLIGWGHESNMDYWLFANSWGTSFGVNGYFKMLRGKNLCGIEEKFSEGFTKKQHQAAAEAMEFDLQINTPQAPEKKDGAWIVHSDHLENFAAVAREALSLKFGEFSGAFELVRVETQVVAGVMYVFEMKVNDEPMTLRVWQDQFLELHLA